MKSLTAQGLAITLSFACFPAVAQSTGTPWAYESVRANTSILNKTINCLSAALDDAALNSCIANNPKLSRASSSLSFSQHKHILVEYRDSVTPLDHGRQYALEAENMLLDGIPFEQHQRVEEGSNPLHNDIKSGDGA